MAKEKELAYLQVGGDKNKEKSTETNPPLKPQFDELLGRYLNNLTIKYDYTIPFIDKLLDTLHEATYFSKIDLRWKDHLIHLKTVLDLMRKHKLFAKKSKCQFRQQEIEYLRHIISQEQVSTDPQKADNMLDWPVPITIKQLRGFLGLTGNSLVEWLEQVTQLKPGWESLGVLGQVGLELKISRATWCEGSWEHGQLGRRDLC
ncbi:pol polyprotein [Striga asiatica]|uniref:Pol polyprotein n=1 Tax=Striga asiatica TaxID=4170 RepID=A0A5A7QXE4_STRAF|nr:pol polyprotein [Striga asiatica]